MIEYATVARPYAKAVFELAQEKEQFAYSPSCSHWSRSPSHE